MTDDADVPDVANAAPVETKEEAETTGRRLTEAQWAEIVERAELGTSKSSELAREFGISPQAVSNYFRKHGITVGSRKGEIAAKVGAALGAATAERTVTFEDERKKRIEETKTDHYNWTTLLTKQMMRKVVEALKSSTPLSSQEAEIRTFQRALKGLEISRKERYAILDVENLLDETTLPEIRIRDLSEEDIAALRATDVEDDGLGDIDDIVSEGEDESS